jgi:FMN-dependent NADH-azoreductase
MRTLLRIDSSPLPDGVSFSRRLTDEFVERWREANPGSTVLARDLIAEPIPAIGAEWISARHAREASLRPRQQEVLALSNQLIGELQAADEYVFGVAMHNFGVPAPLKLWIDQIVRPGKTFRYENGIVVGLLRNKKATFLVASGGVYDADTPRAAINFVDPYLRAIFGFMGVTELRFIHAGGVSRLASGVDRATILQPAMESVHAIFGGETQFAQH